MTTGVLAVLAVGAGDRLDDALSSHTNAVVGFLLAVLIVGSASFLFWGLLTRHAIIVVDDDAIRVIRAGLWRSWVPKCVVRELPPDAHCEVDHREREWYRVRLDRRTFWSDSLTEAQIRHLTHAEHRRDGPPAASSDSGHH